MQQKYISRCQHSLQHSYKLEFYNILKNEYAHLNYQDPAY